MNLANKFSKHWIVLIALSLTAMASLGMVINVGGIFLKPISQDLGILQGTIAVHASLTQFTSAIVGVFVPKLIDRFPINRIIMAGILLISLSSMLLGLSSQVWQFNILGLIRGVGVGLTALVPLSMTINQWFKQHYGLANSIVMMMPGLVGVVFSPLMSSLVELFSWRVAYFSVGVIVLLLGLFPIFYSFQYDPKTEGLNAYGEDEKTSENQFDTQTSKNESTLSKVKITMTSLLTFMLMSFLISGITSFNQHLPSLASYLGYSSVISGSVLSAAMIGNIFFKSIIGVLVDKTNAIFGSLTVLAATILAIFLFMVGNTELILVLASFMMGSIYAVSTVGITTMTSQVFTSNNFGRVYPVITFAKSLGVALFISIYGYVYDFSGSYYPNLWLMLVIIAIALLFLFISYRSRTTEKNK